MKVEIYKADLWPMLLSAIRYAMGRRSYIVGMVTEWVKQYAPLLAAENLDQIRREIVEELTRCENMGRTLGDPMDHAAWRDLAKWIEDTRNYSLG